MRAGQTNVQDGYRKWRTFSLMLLAGRVAALENSLAEIMSARLKSVTLSQVSKMPRNAREIGQLAVESGFVLPATSEDVTSSRTFTPRYFRLT